MLETPGHLAHSRRERATEIKIYAYNIEISENINKNILLTRLPFLPYNYNHCSEYDKVYVWFPYSKNISRTLSFLKLKPLIINLHFLKGRYAWAISYSTECSVTLWSSAWVTLPGLIQLTFWVSSKCQASCQLHPEAALLSRSSWSSSCLWVWTDTLQETTTASYHPCRGLCCWVCVKPQKEKVLWVTSCLLLPNNHI